MGYAENSESSEEKNQELKFVKILELSYLLCKCMNVGRGILKIL